MDMSHHEQPDEQLDLASEMSRLEPFLKQLRDQQTELPASLSPETLFTRLDAENVLPFPKEEAAKNPNRRRWQRGVAAVAVICLTVALTHYLNFTVGSENLMMEATANAASDSSVFYSVRSEIGSNSSGMTDAADTESEQQQQQKDAPPEASAVSSSFSAVTGSETGNGSSKDSATLESSETRGDNAFDLAHAKAQLVITRRSNPATGGSNAEEKMLPWEKAEVVVIGRVYPALGTIDENGNISTALWLETEQVLKGELSEQTGFYVYNTGGYLPVSEYKTVLPEEWEAEVVQYQQETGLTEQQLLEGFLLEADTPQIEVSGEYLLLLKKSHQDDTYWLIGDDTPYFTISESGELLDPKGKSGYGSLSDFANEPNREK